MSVPDTGVPGAGVPGEDLGTALDLATDRPERAEALAARSGSVGVVLTMGALHEGHEALIRYARARCETVVVTVFVNPLQFAAGEDLGRYPRTLDEDLRVCRQEGVDVVFAPSADVVYPDGEPQVRVDPGPLGEVLEGASRPGHFAGVLTVVCKLLNMVDGAEATFFGEKDYQQVVLVRRMVRDLDLGVEVVAVPTVREPDGLALSSRNRYLSGSQRRTATALSRALAAGSAAEGGGAAAVLAAADAVLDGEPGLELDYLHLCAADLGPPPDSGPARLLVAARVGTTRLIDNAAIHVRPSGREEA
jgi:pantoate--beta-alanine ligase